MGTAPTSDDDAEAMEAAPPPAGNADANAEAMEAAPPPAGNADANAEAMESAPPAAGNADADGGPAGPPSEDDATLGDASNDNAGPTETPTSADAGTCGDAAFAAPEPIAGLGLAGALWGPALSADGKTLYLSAVVNSQEHVYSAKRPDRGVTFSAASPVVQVNSTSDEGTPFLSWDGLSLYFYSTRPGGLGDRDVWFATRSTAQSDFLTPVPVVAVNSPALDHAPSLSQDGLTLYVSSRRPRGVGEIDVYVATRALAGQPFSAPVLVAGDAVNSLANDEGAAVSQDGLTIYFGSDRNGTFDIWMATRSDISNAFTAATLLQAVSSPGLDDNPFLTADGQELFFSSNRDGTQQIWRSVRQCP